MAYYKIIESDTTWVCPKTANYKIVCVAGGESGASHISNNTVVYNELGGATSFGDILTADGCVGAKKPLRVSDVGGDGGYTFVNYGGSGGYCNSTGTNNVSTSPSINGGLPACCGLGYGAGGGASIINQASSTTYCYAGRSGKMLAAIVNITAGTTINCVVGAGGVTPSPAAATNGTNGIIIIQEV